MHNTRARCSGQPSRWPIRGQVDQRAGQDADYAYSNPYLRLPERSFRSRGPVVFHICRWVDDGRRPRQGAHHGTCLSTPVRLDLPQNHRRRGPGARPFSAAQLAAPSARRPVPRQPDGFPVAVAAWIDDIAIDLGVEPDGDSTTVGVMIGDVLEINVAEFETRPFVGLQTANNTDGPIAAVLLMVPEEFDPATLILPGGRSRPAGRRHTCRQLPGPRRNPGHCLLPGPGAGFLRAGHHQWPGRRLRGHSPAEVEVPDIFATPAG